MPSSSALVTAVLKAGTDVTALKAADVALQAQDIALKGRMSAAEALTPSSSALVTAVLKAGTDITALQAADTAQVTATSAVATRVTAAESLTPGSSALVTAVLNLSGNTGGSSLVSTLAALSTSVSDLATLSGSSALVTGLTALQTLPLVSNGIPMLLWSELANTIVVEKSFTGAATQKISIPDLPAGTQYVLADVWGSCATDDQMFIWLGRGTASTTTTWTAARGGQPSLEFGDVKKQATIMYHPGQADGHSPDFGVWRPSQIIPLNPDGTFDMALPGQKCTVRRRGTASVELALACLLGSPILFPPRFCVYFLCCQPTPAATAGCG